MTLIPVNGPKANPETLVPVNGPSRYRIEEAQRDGWGDRAEDWLAWRDEVDTHVQLLTWMSIDDLPDWDYASAFEDGLSPRDAAMEMLDDCGFPFD